MERLAIPVLIAPGDQVGAPRPQFRNEVFRLDPQRRCVGRESHRLGRVGQQGRNPPPGVVAHERLDALAMRRGARDGQGRKVIEYKGEDLPGAGVPGGPGGHVKAVKPERDRMRRVRVVTAHPFDQLAIRFEPAKATAKAGILHRVIGCGAMTGDVFIHQTRLGKTALDGNGTEAMRLHQPLEEPIAEEEDFLAAVERFPEAEHFHRRAH